MGPVVYTSSIGMYAADDADPATGRLAAGATAHPHNHYGVYKQANEGSARVYWLEDGIRSIGLRPLTVYGVGRDQGMTSGPTKAIVAAVLGVPYTVPFGGPTLFQYAEDAARMLVAASRATGVEAASSTCRDGRGRGRARGGDRRRRAGGRRADRRRAGQPAVPGRDRHGRDRGARTDRRDAVRRAASAQSVEIYRALAAAGRLDAEQHGLPVAAPT